MRIFILFSLLVFSTQSWSQSIGSKVKMKAADGKEYTGVIKEIQGNQYKVKYDGFDFESWLTTGQFTLVDSQTNPSGTTGKFKIGNHAEIYDVGMWSEVEILKVQDGKYLIHFVGYTSDYYDKWVEESSLRVKGSGAKSTSTNPDNNIKEGKIPPMSGGIPVLKGTAWYILSIYQKGTTPNINKVQRPYLFCNSGRYEIQTTIFSMGSYTVRGNKLTQVADGADKLTETYTISWNAAGNYIELTSGDTVIRLVYNMPTSC